MRKRLIVVFLVAIGLVVATQAGATRTIPKHYVFSFTVALKPSYTQKFPAVKVTGSGAGSFSIANRQIDRDGSAYWDIVNAHGSISLSARGRVFIRANVVGGTFGTQTIYGLLTRTAALKLRITSSTRFHCAARNADIGLDDSPMAAKGDTESITFYACVPPSLSYTDAPSLQWNGRAPALVVSVKPA